MSLPRIRYHGPARFRALAVVISILLAIASLHCEAWTKNDFEIDKEVFSQQLEPMKPYLPWAWQLGENFIADEPSAIPVTQVIIPPLHTSIFLPGYGTADLSPPSRTA